MLSQADNELLCRVGPGTVMGEMLRQYWLPMLLSSELPEVDGPPLGVKLLGENLIAFRDSSGHLGLVADHCPHRGAGMFFGRNEDNEILTRIGPGTLMGDLMRQYWIPFYLSREIKADGAPVSPSVWPCGVSSARRPRRTS